MTNGQNGVNLQIVRRDNDLGMSRPKKKDLSEHTGLTRFFDDKGWELSCRYVAYLRVSSDKQDHDAQMNGLRNLIRQHATEWDEYGRAIKWLNPDSIKDGGDILYIEEKVGTSAWKKRGKSSLHFRKKGKMLYEMIQQNAVEIVFAFEMSRLYRNHAYGTMFREQLIHEWDTATEIICDDLRKGLRDDDSELYWMMKGYMNEKSSESKSRNVNNAMETNRKKGLSCNEFTWGWNRIPTGNRTNKDKPEYRVEPNWDEQQIRFRCLDMVNNHGWNYSDCCRMLADANIPTKMGRKKFRSCGLKRACENVKMNEVLDDHPQPTKMPSWPHTAYKQKRWAEIDELGATADTRRKQG